MFLWEKCKKRRRTAVKTKKKAAKSLKNLQNIKPRVPTAPGGTIFKSNKDYDRSKNKAIIDKARIDEN